MLAVLPRTACHILSPNCKFFIVARLSSLQSYVLANILNSVFYCLSMDILKVLASYYLGI